MIFSGPFKASIRPDEVLRYLGYRKGKTQISPQAGALVREGLERASALFRPAASAVDLKIVEVRDGEIEVASTGYRSVWKSAKLAKLLSGSSRATTMLITAGPGFEAETDHLFERGDPALATIIDAAGSEAAEALADEVDDLIKQRAASQGFGTTWRFSPGYGGWGLEVQPELVRLLDGDRIGVTVTDTLMLSPQKSITAVIGWYRCPEPLGRSDHPAEKCRRCEMDGCVYRKGPVKPE